MTTRANEAGYSAEFGAAVGRIIGPRTLRRCEELCGLDFTTLSRMKRGKLVRRETLELFANGMGVTGRPRADLFRLAGYIADFQTAGAAP